MFKVNFELLFLDLRYLLLRFNVNKFPRLTNIYHEEFSNYEHEHIQDNFELFIIHGELNNLDIVLIFERHIVFPMVPRLIEFTGGDDNS